MAKYYIKRKEAIVHTLYTHRHLLNREPKSSYSCGHDRWNIFSITVQII